MGVCSDSTNRRKKLIHDDSDEKNKYKCKFTEEKLRNKLIDFYNNAEIIKNKDNKNNDMDLTFIQIQKYEEEKLTSYFLGKKDNFRDIINNFFLTNNINITNNILDNILEIEKGYDIYEDKIKNEIQDIYENKKKFNIKYLTIMILGKS